MVVREFVPLDNLSHRTIHPNRGFVPRWFVPRMICPIGWFVPLEHLSQRRTRPNSGFVPSEDLSHWRTRPNRGFLPLDDLSQRRICPNRGSVQICASTWHSVIVSTRNLGNFNEHIQFQNFSTDYLYLTFLYLISGDPELLPDLVAIFWYIFGPIVVQQKVVPYTYPFTYKPPKGKLCLSNSK